MLEVNGWTRTSADKDVKKSELSHGAGGNAKWCSCFEKIWEFLKRLNMKLLYDPAIPLIGISSPSLSADNTLRSPPVDAENCQQHQALDTLCSSL